MHFAARVRTWRVARLYSVQYSEIALSRKPFGVEHMYVYNFLLRMTDTVTSQNIDLPSWDILYTLNVINACGAVGGMRIGRGNRSIRRKPALLPLVHDFGYSSAHF
jgi:hypothetical protein